MSTQRPIRALNRSRFFGSWNVVYGTFSRAVSTTVEKMPKWPYFGEKRMTVLDTFLVVCVAGWKRSSVCYVEGVARAFRKTQKSMPKQGGCMHRPSTSCVKSMNILAIWVCACTQTNPQLGACVGPVLPVSNP